MGLKNGKAQGSFVGETREQVLAFYGGLVQILKGWRPPAPKLPAARPEHSGDGNGTENGLLPKTEPQKLQDYVPPNG